MIRKFENSRSLKKGRIKNNNNAKIQRIKEHLLHRFKRKRNPQYHQIQG